MYKRTLFTLLLMAAFCVSYGQSAKTSKPTKKPVHKKTAVHKAVTSHDEADDDDYYATDEDLDDDASYIVVMNEEEDDNYYTSDEDEDMVAGKTGHQITTRHTYSRKYPKKLYYYNPKTGYYYKRRVPLKG